MGDSLFCSADYHNYQGIMNKINPITVETQTITGNYKSLIC